MPEILSVFSQKGKSIVDATYIITAVCFKLIDDATNICTLKEFADILKDKTTKQLEETSLSH